MPQDVKLNKPTKMHNDDLVVKPRALAIFALIEYCTVEPIDITKS